MRPRSQTRNPTSPLKTAGHRQHHAVRLARATSARSHGPGPRNVACPGRAGRRRQGACCGWTGIFVPGVGRDGSGGAMYAHAQGHAWGGVGWSGFELQRRTAPHMHTRHMLVPGGNTPQLTVPTGVHMASLPLEPALGKLLLEGCRRGCARVSWSRGEGGVGGTTWPHRLHRWACHQGHAAIADTPPRARCDRRRATARLRLTTCRKR